ncbi:MAG: hypothetical protein II500_00580, partial [Campylobacter sp.]|nr:hypothetical protein [Campylobacter sp.]
MKNHKFNNFSLVLASFLFAVGGVNITNAAIIDGAELVGNSYRGGGTGHSTNTNPSENNVTIANSGSGQTYTIGKTIYGGYLNATGNVLNNNIFVTQIQDTAPLNLNQIQGGFSTLASSSGTETARQVNNNSVVITASNIKANIWAGRVNGN